MSTRFTLLGTPLAGLFVAEGKPLGDERGFLERLFCENEFAELLDGGHVVQINRTFTVNAGSVRGLHFQHPPHAEVKFVSCTAGSAFDVVVDLRPDSATFLRWHGETLHVDDHKMMVIPRGFAHGLQTLVDETEILYFHTAMYMAGAEGGLNAVDPRLGIDWPITITDRSARDRAFPMVEDGFSGVRL